MRCIVSISSRRSGWICTHDVSWDPAPLEAPSPGACATLGQVCPVHGPGPAPSSSDPTSPRPHPTRELHLVHGADLQAQLVHHCDEELRAGVCMRQP